MNLLHEHLPIGPESSVKVAVRRTRHIAFEWHFHDEVELALITRGSGRRFVGDSVDEYRDGDFVLIGSSVPHAWESESTLRDWQEALVAQFRAGSFGAWPELRSIMRLIEQASMGLQFTGEGAEVATQQFLAVSRRDGLQQITALLELLHFLAENDSVERRPITSIGYHVSTEATDERIRKILAILAERYSQPITQAELAQQMGMVPSSFARYFRQATGNTLTQYLQQLRVAAACRQLAETDQRITEVAFSSGFKNLAHFNRTFLAHKEMTPTEYRAVYQQQRM